MAEVADVVVIGGGVVGVSTAYHLARRGVRNVVLLEKGTLGCGATGMSSACVQSNYSHPEVARMALRSVEIMTNFGDLYGGSSGFKRVGHLVIYGASDKETAEYSAELQRGLGSTVKTLSKVEIKELVPWAQYEDIVGATWEESAGYAEPSFVVDTLAAGAQSLGVRIKLQTEATALTRNGANAWRVGTSKGEVVAGVVVMATNAWTPKLAATAGLLLPIEVTRHQIGLLVRPPHITRAGPVFVDLVHQIYYRPDTGQQMLIGSSRDEDLKDVVTDPDSYKRSVDQQQLTNFAQYVLARFPEFEEARFRGGFAGLYDVTPDWQFILGPAPGHDGLYVAAGLSGHGFKFGPLIGQGIAELVADGRTNAFDIGLFGAERFSRGRLIRPERAYAASVGYR